MHTGSWLSSLWINPKRMMAKKKKMETKKKLNCVLRLQFQFIKPLL